VKHRAYHVQVLKVDDVHAEGLAPGQSVIRNAFPSTHVWADSIQPRFSFIWSADCKMVARLPLQVDLQPHTRYSFPLNANSSWE
jgi:hypothetical protein